MSPLAWDDALVILRAGLLVAFPTDTVYGVGCDPRNLEAIERLYAAKGRAREKAIPLLLSDAANVEEVAVDPSPGALALAQIFWPGALTLVVPRAARLPVSLSGTQTIAIRVPDHLELRAMIARFGGAVAASSANLSGMPDATSPSEAEAYLRDSVKLIVDGGVTPGAVPSTVVDCTTDPPRVLREGRISAAQIRQALAGHENAGA